MLQSFISAEKNLGVRCTLILWSQRDLSLYGKITIAKTLGLSKLIFVSSCIHTPPHYIDITNKLNKNNNKKPKIKRDMLIGPKESLRVHLSCYKLLGFKE